MRGNPNARRRLRDLKEGDPYPPNHRGASHGPCAEKGEDKIGIGLISDTVVQTVLLDIHIIGPKYRCVSLPITEATF